MTAARSVASAVSLRMSRDWSHGAKNHAEASTIALSLEPCSWCGFFVEPRLVSGWAHTAFRAATSPRPLAVRGRW